MAYGCAKKANQIYENILIIGSSKPNLTIEQLGKHWPHKNPKITVLSFHSKNDTPTIKKNISKILASKQINILFCIDEAFSYQQAIHLTEELRHENCRFWYYNSNSGCIINSSNKQKTGEVIIVEKKS
jgi:hypothetical protein